MMRDILQAMPRKMRRLLSPLDFAALARIMDWTQATPQCEQVPVPHGTHRGIMYHFPTPKGANTTCLEYAIADEYYKEFVAGDAEALPLLAATLWREEDKDAAAALRRGDRRVRLYDKAEIEARARLLRDMPEDLQLQALTFFGGLKQYVHRVYGKWIFEEQEEDEDDDTQGAEKPGRGPDFGWWGILQQVAEARVFGNVQEVYQASLHEVCVFLVRKRIEQENIRSQAPAMPRREEEEN